MTNIRYAEAANKVGGEKRRGEVLLTSCHCGEMIRCVSKSLMLVSAPNLGGEQKAELKAPQV